MYTNFRAKSLPKWPQPNVNIVDISQTDELDEINVTIIHNQRYYEYNAQKIKKIGGEMIKIMF